MQNLMTYEDVGKYLQVADSTVRAWVKQKKIPDAVLFKIPGDKSTIRFIPSKLEDWTNGRLQT